MTLSADPNLDRQVLVEVFPYDDIAGATVPIYLATRDVTFYASDPNAPNREYDGRLVSAFTLKRQMHRDDLLGGPSLPAYGGVRVLRDTVFVENGGLRAWRRYGWDGRRVRVLIGAVGAAYAAHEVLLDGVVQGVPAFGATEITIPIADLQERLSADVEAGTYTGAGGFAGGADLKNKRTPFAVGIFRGMEPVPVDLPNLWYDVSPSTGLHSLTLVTDGAAALSPSASNPPPSGSYFLDAAGGRLRLGMRPTYILRVDGRSAFAANAQTVADIVQGLLIQRLGFTLAQLSTTSFAVLNALNGAAVGYVAKDVVTGQAVIDALINSIGGYYTADRHGLFTVGRIAPPVANGPNHPAVRLYIDDTDLERGSFVLTPADKPPWRVELGHRRNWTVLSSDQVAGAANDANRAFATEEYRVAADERTATRTKHLLSKPLRRDTLIDDPVAAASEATRSVSLISVPRETAECRLQTQPLLLDLGDEVWVQSAIYDVDAAFRVVGDDQSAREGRVSLTLWR